MKLQWMIFALALTTATVAHADSNRAGSARQIAEAMGTIDGAVAYCVAVDPKDKQKFHKLHRDLVRLVQGMSDRGPDDDAKSPAYRAAFKAIQDEIRAKYAAEAPTLCATIAQSI